MRFARTSSCFVAAGLWLATSASFQTPTNSAQVDNSSVATPEYEPLLEPTPEKAPVEVIDLTVKDLPNPGVTNTRIVSTQLTEGFRPGSVDPGRAEAEAVARTQQWTLAEVFVENSEVTESGYVEYTLRASIRGDGASATATEVIAEARAVSPEVSVVAESLHFTTKPGDELDSLSRDAIRVRIKGGLTFEPSMLRWSFIANPIPSEMEVKSAESAPGDSAESAPLPQVPLPDRQLESL